MAPVAIAVAVGIVVDRLAEPCGTTTWATAALVASAVALLTNRWAWASIPALLAAMAAIGGAWHHWRWSDLAADDLARVLTEEPRPSWVRGVVRTVPEHRVGPVAGERPGDEGFTRFELQLTAASDGERWHRASGRAMVAVGGDRTDLAMGDAIEAAGMLALLAGPLNPGERDPRESPRSRGIRLRLSIDGPEGIAPDPAAKPVRGLRWLGRIRSWSERKLSAMLDAQTAPMASALLLGNRGGIDGTTSGAFSRTGTAHLLAISGLHLSAVAGALGWLAVLIGLDHKAAARLVLVATIGYATLVGWSPSVSRAAAMVAVVCLAAILDRSSRPANTITLAALFTMAVNPSYLFGVGWQLSFLAVSVLILGVPPLLRRIERRAIGTDPDGDPLDRLERRLEPRWRRAARRLAIAPLLALAASAAVWLATMPLIAWRFNVVAPIGIALNVPLIPMVGGAVVSGGLALVASTVWEPLGLPAAWACDRLLSWTLAIVARAESVRWGHAFVPSPPTAWVIAGYATLAVAARASAARWPRPARRGAWLGVGLVGAFGAIVTVTPQRPASFEVEQLAVGHGLATVIRGPDGSASIFDCGRAGDPSVGRRIVAPALWSRGIRRIDTLILSHADSDHYNGTPDLIERFPIGTIVVPDGFDASNNPGAGAVIDAAVGRGIAVREVAQGDRVEVVPGLVAEVLHPPRGWLPDAADNDRSLVLDLAIGGRHLLLTGDLDGAGLAELVAMPPRAIDVMVAPHHGGRTANPPWLYDWADPRAVVVSQRAPRPGTGDALAPLSDRGIAVHRTWHEGALRIAWVAEESSDPPTPRGWVVRPGPEASSASARARVVAASIGPAFSSSMLRWAVAIVGLLLGAWLCGAITIIHWGAWSLVLPGRGIGQAGTLPEPWRSAAIEARDGTGLHAWCREPAWGSPGIGGRIALIVHGLAEASPSMQGRGEALAEAGWSVVLPDLRGFGRSGGDRASFGAREAGDLRAWIDALLADRPGATVVIWGRSMGAAVALRAAAEDGRIAALVLEAPYADLRRALRSRLERLRFPGAGGLAGPVLRKASRLAGMPLNRPRPIDLAGRVSIPVLILEGGADVVAPRAEVRRLCDAFPADRRPELVSVDDAGHAEVFDRGGAALRDRIVGFLDRVATRPGA